jgi:hypothetical protein
MILHRFKKHLISFLESEYKELSKLSNYDNFTDLVYNYWKYRR